MNNKIISAIGTAVVMALVVLVLLAFGYDPPDPPIAEEGVEVNVGNSDFGYGDDPQPSSTASSYAPPAAQSQMSTQVAEPTPSLNATRNDGNTTNPNATPQPTVANKEPEINKNALFTGRRNQNSGSGSQGQSTGSGDQGKVGGTPSSNNYVGEGGGNGSYSLKGRNAVSLPKPKYNSNKQGTIIVKIWVDQQGRVTRVEAPDKGSTLTDGTMVEQAKAAARRARFNASTSAPEEQTGTITYIFKI